MRSKKPVHEATPRGAMSLRAFFNRATRKTAMIAGKPLAIVTAFVLVLIWAVTGPFLGFSDVWQLTINTATTIITFLMVFIIQNSQNRDGLAIQIKLDELLRAQGAASNALFDLEELAEEELEELQKKYEALSATTRALKERRGKILPSALEDPAERIAAARRTKAKDRARRKRPRATARRSKA